MVVYITSMPAVRETYEQCQRIVLVLRAHQVAFVAKDIYLHPDYNEELRLRLGETKLTVPQVRLYTLLFSGSCLSTLFPVQLYIDGEYVGGSEIVEELNECGELASMLKGFEVTNMTT